MPSLAHKHRSGFGRLGADTGLPLLSRVTKRVAWHLRIWNERHRTRRALSRLTQAQLDDIGLTREAAREEALKLFWRP